VGFWNAKVQELPCLRKASFGLPFEKALADLAIEAFLGLTIASEKPDHSL
jgi:hypothetical protein